MNIFSRFKKKQLVTEHSRRRISRDALDGLPHEKFLRLVGLFNAVVPVEWKRKQNNEYVNEIVREFEALRQMIDQKLDENDAKFQRDEMGDYVHNLNLLLAELLPADALAAALPAVRDDYRTRVSAETYNAYIASPIYKSLEGCDRDKTPDRHLELLRTDYVQLTNEVRRLTLLEYHIEETRDFLIGKLRRTLFKVMALPIAIVVLFFVCRAATVNMANTLLPSSGSTQSQQTGLSLSRWITSYLIYGGNQNQPTTLYKALIMSALLSLSAIAGAVGSFISALLRIEAVPENNEIGRNIVALRYSESIRLAPVTGLTFAILLSLLFGGKLLNGLLFPDTSIAGSWPYLLFFPAELAKWLVWAFIAGFSERLMPDMIDRFVDKAGKSMQAASPSPPAGNRGAPAGSAKNQLKKHPSKKTKPSASAQHGQGQ
jgi:hypothetical protein